LEIMIVVALIGLLAAIALPSMMKARMTSQTNACINNLRQIESAKEQWALAARKNTGDPVVTTEVDVYMKKAPICPGGGVYDYQALGTDAQCTSTGHTL
jgi:type II secretory pathway pseudopilin PulG